MNNCQPARIVMHLSARVGGLCRRSGFVNLVDVMHSQRCLKHSYPDRLNPRFALNTKKSCGWKNCWASWGVKGGKEQLPFILEVKKVKHRSCMEKKATGMRWCNHLNLDKVHPWIAQRQWAGKTATTVNKHLKTDQEVPIKSTNWRTKPTCHQRLTSEEKEDVESRQARCSTSCWKLRFAPKERPTDQARKTLFSHSVNVASGFVCMKVARHGMEGRSKWRGKRANGMREMYALFNNNDDSILFCDYLNILYYCNDWWSSRIGIVTIP